ncbi:MAG TPA: beta-L-arabinofuranosidase domain-containing protein [Verrucomicrobiae bacterium]|nr:beta-L-arabinofuranosidase domain-containing protein [Verrucomicrobiae bacterium]
MQCLFLNATMVGLFSLAAALHGAPVVVDAVPPAVKDRQEATIPAAIQLGGFLGKRLDANVTNRLAKVDEERLLEGFRKRPGRQAWDGEHAGKWLHAATLAWEYSQGSELRTKLDRVVAELGKCQMEDGYLGTYLPEQRWTEWDVWAHKYDMLGLLTYYRATGNTNALAISRRCADLLCRTFGTNAGQRDILKAGWHMGMAPTSVLEPMVLLYRLTGETKYLEFCRYILASWETPAGPKIVSTLLSAKRVDKVGNAKAYEMLSCLNGALEFYRTTGEKQLLEAALNAWQDIVNSRLYLTGTASHHEHFHKDHELPNGNADVGETCVTVTWIQFNAQLLRLTGEARFAEELERAVYNQLLGAQKPDGSGWGYYVQLEGKKPYSAELSGHCCLSSGPRGLALVPTFAVTADHEGVIINFLTAGKSRLRLPDGKFVRLEIESGYPGTGDMRVKVVLDQASVFTLKLRVPAWSQTATLSVNDRSQERSLPAGEYAALRREWHDGDVITLRMPMSLRTIVGAHGNAGKVAFARGPLILAADDALNPGAPIGTFRILPAQSKMQAGTLIGEQRGSVHAIRTTPSAERATNEIFALQLISFAEAGSTQDPYQVWMPLAEQNPGGVQSP